MAETGKTPKRKLSPWILGAIVLMLFLFLVMLQTSNLWKNLSVETASDTLLLYALSSFNFIALIVFGFIFLRSIIKLARERRALQLGSKIKTRLLLYFFLVSLLPIFAMAIFSYLFMNRALERWFTQIPENVVREAREVQNQSLIDRTKKLNEAVNMLAKSIESRQLKHEDLADIANAGNLSYIEVVDKNGQTDASYEREVPANQRGELAEIIEAIHAGNTSVPEFSDGRGFDVAIAEMSGGRSLVIVPDPFGEQSVSQLVDSSLREFDELKDKQITVRQVGLLTLGVLTFLLIFASSWIAFYVARGITAPIQALANGARRVAGGELGYRVNVQAEDELELLIGAFNDMSSTLESNSAELSERRRYIETVLDSLPTGVISFDSNGRVETINQAALSILRLPDHRRDGVGFDKLFEGENVDIIERLFQRSFRVGHASEQIQLPADIDETGSSVSTVALSMTALPAGGGVVLVIEDLSELIAAQRASAWQEVARRMAHEIKNPLTPIQLSAERIAKRFSNSALPDNGAGKRIDDKGPISTVVEESTATILREVSSLKSMVDEFSRFARLPDAELVTGSINDVIDKAVVSYEGRHADVEIEVTLADDLPNVMLDPEQLGRVFVNLIENSVEAFDPQQPDKHITIRTRHDAARELVIAEVADNGKGIDPSALQKLFQPYFSTKGRGTGLGLAIVNRIIAEHHGKIRPAQNHPNGAKFTIELPIG